MLNIDVGNAFAIFSIHCPIIANDAFNFAVSFLTSCEEVKNIEFRSIYRRAKISRNTENIFINDRL